ncbi:MAG: energy transducer TonB [Lysobacterales bacterium]
MRRRIGFIGSTVLIDGWWYVCDTGRQPDQPASTDLDYNSSLQPHYPAGAITNKQEGSVILDVLVSVDGTPRKVEMDSATRAAPNLIKAVSDAVMQWHFSPMMKNGKPVEGRARNPMKFSLALLPSTPAPLHISSKS